MTQARFWIALLTLTAALVFHAAFPRYDVHTLPNSPGMYRVDRWTGAVELTDMAAPVRWLTVRLR